MSNYKNPQILVELQDCMGDDQAIADAAWTSSYDKDRREAKYDEPERIKHLIENVLLGHDVAHNVPFESVVLRFWIRHPIFSDRQHQTHRLQSSSGLSGRYRTMPLDYFEVPPEVEEIFKRANQEGKYIPLGYLYKKSCDKATQNYKITIDCLKEAQQMGYINNSEYKRAREIARGQLPTAGMVERTFLMNLSAFANYQLKRNSEHAQPEIKQVAEMMLHEVESKGVAPIAVAALKKRGWKL